MAKLTQAEHKSLHDKLGADLADFFKRAHGVEGDEPDPSDNATGDDGDKDGM